MGDENKILTAVRQLDTSNDNHWTADGQPRIETVKMLVGDGQPVGRSDIDAAAPGFNRATAAGYGEDQMPGGDHVDGQAPPVPAQGEPTQQDAPAPPPPLPSGAAPGIDAEGGPSDGSAEPAKPQGELDQDAKHTSVDTTEPPAASGDPTKTDADLGDPAPRGAGLGDDGVTVATQAELVALDHGVPGDADDLADMEEDLEGAKARTAELRGKVDDLTAQLAQSMLDEARLLAAIEAVRPRTGTMEAIQMHFRAADEEAAKTIAAREMLAKSGVNLAELQKMVKPSLLDQAMSGK